MFVIANRLNGYAIKCNRAISAITTISKQNFFAGLAISGLNNIFHLTGQSCINFKSCSMFSVEYFSSYIIAIKEISSANSFGLQIRCSGRSLINTRNKRGPKTDPSGTPDLIGLQDELAPFIITLCFLLLR